MDVGREKKRATRRVAARYVAVDVVQSEPVSVQEFPLTGKNTGNFTNSSGLDSDKTFKNPDPEPFYGHLPSFRPKSEQGFNRGVSGN